MQKRIISKSMKKRIEVQSQKPKYRESYKIVLMPIRVPVGKYCWNCTEPPHEVCTYFNNEHGHPGCDLGLYPLEEQKDGSILKPKRCLNFEEENKDAH